MSASIQAKLPDGKVIELESGATPLELARAIGPGLAKAAVAAVVDGEEGRRLAAEAAAATAPCARSAAPARVRRRGPTKRRREGAVIRESVW